MVQGRFWPPEGRRGRLLPSRPACARWEAGEGSPQPRGLPLPQAIQHGEGHSGVGWRVVGEGRCRARLWTVETRVVGLTKRGKGEEARGAGACSARMVWPTGRCHGQAFRRGWGNTTRHHLSWAEPQSETGTAQQGLRLTQWQSLVPSAPICCSGWSHAGTCPEHPMPSAGAPLIITTRCATNRPPVAPSFMCEAQLPVPNEALRTRPPRCADATQHVCLHSSMHSTHPCTGPSPCTYRPSRRGNDRMGRWPRGGMHPSLPVCRGRT